MWNVVHATQSVAGPLSLLKNRNLPHDEMLTGEAQGKVRRERQTEVGSRGSGGVGLREPSLSMFASPKILGVQGVRASALKTSPENVKPSSSLSRRDGRWAGRRGQGEVGVLGWGRWGP